MHLYRRLNYARLVDSCSLLTELTPYRFCLYYAESKSLRVFVKLLFV